MPYAVRVIRIAKRSAALRAESMIVKSFRPSRPRMAGEAALKGCAAVNHRGHCVTNDSGCSELTPLTCAMHREGAGGAWTGRTTGAALTPNGELYGAANGERNVRPSAATG